MTRQRAKKSGIPPRFPHVVSRLSGRWKSCRTRSRHCPWITAPSRRAKAESTAILRSRIGGRDSREENLTAETQSSQRGSPGGPSVKRAYLIIFIKLFIYFLTLCPL